VAPAQLLRRASLTLAVLVCTLPASASHGPSPAPFFAVFPVNAPPGASITVSGFRWDPAGGAAVVVLTSVHGVPAVLGAAAIGSDGTFSRQFTLPSAPGTYHINAQDLNGHFAINLHGPVQVLSDARPWFGVRPSIATPGSTVGLQAGGFVPGTTGAVYGLISRTGHVTWLGAAPVVSGGLTLAVPLPASLPPGAYYPFVSDSARRSAFNATGVITIASEAPPPTIAVGSYPIGAAVNPATGRLYVPNGGDNTLSVIDESTGLHVAAVPVGGLPCAIALNPVTNRIYVANVNTNTLSIVDGTTNAVVATVPTGSAPCAVTVLPQLDRVFVGNYNASSITVIDAAARAVVDTLPVASPPYALASNPTTNEVFVALGHTHGLAVIDGVSLQSLVTIPVGLAPDAIGVDAGLDRVYVANYLGHTLTVVDASARSVLRTIPVGGQPSGVGVDPALNLIYVGNWLSDTVTVIDGETLAVVADLPVGRTPDGGVVNPLNHRAYMVNSMSNDVSVIDGATIREK
jgi:YVTN family beta-propeller protein